MSAFGYTGKILKIDLTNGNIAKLATGDYADRFLGGRGIASKIYWDMVPPKCGAFDKENCLIIITGPLAGFTQFSGCRWQICGKSPQMESESFSFANLGGSWGAWLKYTQYDGMVISGRAEYPVYLYLNNGEIEIRSASSLWGKTTMETEDILKSELGNDVKVLEIGPAAENLVYFSTVYVSGHASGSSGIGSVFGSKKLKAIVIRVGKKKRPPAADPDRLKSLAKQVYQQREKNWEPYPEFNPTGRSVACHGCISGCSRRVYEAENGRDFKSFCQAALAYADAALQYSEKGTEAYQLSARLCDKYGLDSAVMQPLIMWIRKCYEAGILRDKETGLPLSKIGSAEFIEKLVKKVSFREGFGDILASGPVKAAEHIGKGSEELIASSGISTLGGETTDYDPRYFLPNALLYATEPRRPIQMLHAMARPMMRWNNWYEKGGENYLLSTEILFDIAEKYWGSKAAADFSTYEGKALAAKTIQDYSYVKESMIICDLVWPMHEVISPDKKMACCTLESQIVSAITGKEMDETDLLNIGERNANMQRAILLLQGWPGRDGDNIMNYLHDEPLQGVYFSPEALGPNGKGEIVSRRGVVLERDKFEQMKGEYYALRGWDPATGFPTINKLEQLDLGDVALVLQVNNLAV